MNTREEVEFDYQAHTREHGPDPSKIRSAREVLQQRREAFKARLINHVNMEVKHAREMKHVFISYCHENKTTVDRLCQALISHKIHIWLDRDNIGPGKPWKQAIQQAIQQGDFFIACFSKEANARNQTYMNEELNLAIKELHRRPVDRVWFIPIKLNACEIPDIDIAEGVNLQDLQYVNLHENWDAGIQTLVNTISLAQDCRASADKEERSTDVLTDEDNECVLFRSVEGQHYFIPFEKVRWDSMEISLTLCPISSEQIAFLCSLRKDRHDILAFAHGEEATWVKPQEIAQISTEGGTVWKVALKEDTTGKAFKQRTEAVGFKNLTPDRIAYMRAKRILLDEKLETTDLFLTQTTVFHQMLLETAIRGELSSQYGNRIQALTSPIPELYRQFRNTPERFKKFARLISVLYLKLSNTVEDILQLDVELMSSTELKVKFRGRRHQLDVNEDPMLLEFDEICPLPK